MILDAKTVLRSFVLLACAAPAWADRIHLTEGRTIEDVEIVSEGLTQVVYKLGREERTIDSDKVAWVEFDKLPRLLDEARGFLVEDDVRTAVGNIDQYVDGQIENPNERRYPFAPAWGAWQAVELRQELADLAGVRKAAARLIAGFPDSRYLPSAYLAKASAEAQMGRPEDAQATLGKLEELVSAKSLSARWSLECRLAQVRTDISKSGEDKRSELTRIATEAGASYPTVASRATVSEGETYLAEAEEASIAAAKPLREKARAVFERIVSDPKADAGTLAAAHTGLGDCLFYLGAEADDAAVLSEAAVHYLRVITLYKEQSQYVPKSLFYAMRCFDLMQDRGRKADMRRELASLYPESSWATEAEKFQ